MIDKIKSYTLHRIMTYLNSHSGLKEFIKRVVYSNVVLEKMAFRAFRTNTKKFQKDTLCNKRAQRAYEALKEGVGH
jgi:hypothetical protein